MPTLVRDRDHLIEEIQAAAYDLIFIVLSDHNIGLIDLVSDMDGISPPVVAILEVEDEQFALDLMQKDIDYLVKSSITPARLSRSLAYHINHRKAHDASRWLHAVVDSSADAIVGKNIHNIIISWNKGAEKIFGYTAAEVIGNPVTILMPDDRKQDADFILAEILAGRNVAQYTTIRKHKSGRLIDVSISAAPVLDNHGNITGVSITTRDVTTRNVRQRVLLDQAEKLRAAFELAHLGSWEWLIEEDRVIWDEGMVDLFGGKRLDTPPSNLTDFINLLHPDDGGDFAQFLASLAIGGEADSIDCRIIWPDGSVHSITTKSQSKVQNKTKQMESKEQRSSAFAGIRPRPD